MEDRLIPRTAPPPASQREEEFVLVALGVLFLITAASWALALWPVQQSTGWIARTRYACFGVSSNGLPDAGGWIALIGGPIGMLAILTAGWSRGLFALFDKTRRPRRIATALHVLAFGTITLLAGAAIRVRQVSNVGTDFDALEVLAAADYKRMNRPAPQLSLTAQTGERFELASLHRRTVLVTFGYAHCATVCPLVVQRVLKAQAQLDTTVAVVIVTLDPWRDTSTRLASMATTWRLPARNAWVLSGPVDSVETALDAWHVPRTRDARTGEITHPGLVYIVDPQGRIAFAANAPSIETLVELVRRTALP